MGRWAPDAAMRLERAALQLFAEQGYTATTVPQITARAGLTTRTFFRHFADKREVLFLRQREFPVVVSTLLDAAPAGLSPVDLVVHGLEALVTGEFEEWRADIAVRRAVVRSDERLRERELLKTAVLTDTIGQALVQHGVEARTAALTARYAALLFEAALDEWLDGDADRPLVEVLHATRARLQQLIA